MNLSFIVPGDPDQRTGGYLYDARLVSELRAMGWSVTVISLDGRFPDADQLAVKAMATSLATLPDQARVVIDGLALGAVPEAVQPHAKRLDMTALVHHPLADETGIDPVLRERLLACEQQALAACRRVLVTSRFSALRLVELGLCSTRPQIIEPGVDAAELARPVVRRLAGENDNGPEVLLCVASLVPRKGQDVLVEALAGLSHKSWQCVLAGSLDRDPAYAARMLRAIEFAGLDNRIAVLGERSARQLAGDYQRASVCVLPSHYEGYGMVVTEALARGLPLICTTGGALVDTVPEGCGLKVDPGNSGALKNALEHWLDDPGLRLRLTRQATQSRATLGSWPDAAASFARALKR